MSTTPFDHHIEVTDGAVEFTCTAEQGAQCRLGCSAECEDHHRPQCDRTLKDIGSCWALPYLAAGDPSDAYLGVAERHAWCSGPIDIEWDNYYESWVWRFPGEDRQLPGLAQRDAV